MDVGHYIGYSIVILLVLNAIFTQKYGHQKKPKFFRVFEIVSLFFIPAVPILIGISDILNSDLWGILFVTIGAIIAAFLFFLLWIGKKI